MGIAYKKAVNEVKYWLKENHKTLNPQAIDTVAKSALNLYTGTDYSSLEAAVEDVLLTIFTT